jgi:predicted deacetylase
MAPNYIVRFDDICPTMNWEVWEQIEKILVDYQIFPIVAVVPDNKDKNLMVRSANSEFWKRVALWQARGWTIGVHGYQHLYVNHHSGLIAINRRSEFAGLAYNEQIAKLKKALKRFRQENISPEIWVSPAHSFDTTTLVGLKNLGLCLVSDGFYLFPNVDSLGITHIPQHLWKFRWLPFGLWTVCYHHNAWTRRELDRFESDICRYRKYITSVRRGLADYQPRNRNCFDRVVAAAYVTVVRIRVKTLHGLVKDSASPEAP